jgi:hypothetical protein
VSKRSKHAIEITQDDLFTVVVALVRYSLGRRSYVVGQACDLVKHYGPMLAPGELEVVRRDIAEELNRTESRNATLGDKCDHESWKRLVAWIEQQQRP